MINKPLHISLWQVSVSMLTPSQYFPPLSGSGSEHDLRLCLVPLPQLTEHSAQLSHLDHSPSTEISKSDRLKNIWRKAVLSVIFVETFIADNVYVICSVNADTDYADNSKWYLQFFYKIFLCRFCYRKHLKWGFNISFYISKWYFLWKTLDDILEICSKHLGRKSQNYRSIIQKRRLKCLSVQVHI